MNVPYLHYFYFGDNILQMEDDADYFLLLFFTNPFDINTPIYSEISSSSGSIRVHSDEQEVNYRETRSIFGNIKFRQISKLDYGVFFVRYIIHPAFWIARRPSEGQYTF